jgi:hypothetical protein
MRRNLALVVLVGLVAAVIPATAPSVDTPPAPAGPTGLALDRKVELAWQPVSGATSYNVYRGTSATAVTTLLTPSGTTATTHSDTAVNNNTTYYYAVRAVASGTESASSLVVQARPVARGCSTGNVVALENCFPGSASWRANNTAAVGSGGIEGFATQNSINKGESVALKVNADAGSTFRVEVYRSGYYGGEGARLFSTIRGVTGVPQPACITDATTGLVDCSNWSVSATLTTTASWPSGIYLLKLIRQDTNRNSHILLTVRDDARTAQLLYGSSVTTYQAYNNYGGRSLYDFNSTGSNTVAGTPRAVKVSFDRPYTQVRTGQRDWYTKIDYPWVYWLEQAGYDLAYAANTDLERNGARVRDHRAYFSPSHDEYYSAAMRTALEEARDAGVGLFFGGSNEIYWKIRFEDSPVSGARDRVEVGYKSTQSGGPDPSGIHTGTWRDPAGANKPENGLTGVMYVGDNDTGYFPLRVTATDGADRIWRYTGLDSQAPGTFTNIGTDLVGWEWDARVANGSEPAGVKTLASTPVTGQLIQGNGRFQTPGSTTSHVVKYTAAGGALVFTTGTNHWARGLAVNEDGTGSPDLRIQQATTNVLADMNVPPQTPAGGIVVENPGPRPPAPAGLTAQAIGSDSVQLSWGAVSGAEGYNVYRTLASRDGGEPLGARANGSLVTGTSFTDIGLSSGTTYYYVVTAVSGGVQSLSSNEAQTTTAASVGEATRVNSGGPAYTSTAGQTFGADNFVTGGTVNAVGPTTAISGTSDPALYRDERWGTFSYAIPVAAGKYDVRFHFVELYYGSGGVPGGAGMRVFGMDVLDTAGVDLQNIDIYAEVGPRAALTKTVTRVSVTDGVLNIRGVYGAADDPQIAAIEVIPRATAPTVTETVPADGELGVTTLVKPRATFSRSMKASTITNSTFTVTRGDGTPVAATVSYDVATATATLTPNARLNFSTVYTARLEATIEAADDEPLGAPVSWTFTTQDAVPPQVTSTFPAAGATGISPSARPRATFSRSLDPATVTASSFTLEPSGGAAVAASVSYDAATRSAILTPAAPLDFSTTYTARLSTAITTTDGVPLTEPFTWSFTTAASAPAPPTVTDRTPAPGATDVVVTTPVTATFSRDMDAATITSATFTLTTGSTAVSAVVTYDPATRVAQLLPASRLGYSTTYDARLDGTIHAADGTPLAGAVTWSFTTGDPPPAPTVTSTSPADGSTYNARSSNVTATFSRNMDPATLTAASFTLRRSDGSSVAGAVSYDATTRTATFDPSNLLAGGKTFTARIDTTARAADGAALSAPVSWTFVTAACPCSLFSALDQPAQQNLPTQDGRSGTGPWSYELGVKVKVDQPMRLTAIRFFKSSLETGSHTGRLWSVGTGEISNVPFATETASGWQEQTLSSQPLLQPGIVYVVSVNANAYFGLTGAGLAGEVVSGPLRTVADGRNGVYGSSAGVFPTESWNSANYYVDLDVVPDGDPANPGVTGVAPADGATGVSRNATVSATFSRSVDPETVNGSTFTVSGPSGAVAGTVSYEDATKTGTFTPAAPLAYTTVYTARVSTGVRARDGKPLGTPATWSFTVADPVPPQVTAVDPLHGANDIGAGAKARATFSKPLDATTVNASTFTLSGPGGPIPAAVSYDSPSRTAVLTPSSPLAEGATYTARLDPAITATDDARLATEYTWSFTVAAPGPPPTVTSFSPSPDGVQGVSTAAVVHATFSRSMDPSTITGSSFTLKTETGALVATTVGYDSTTKTAKLTPIAKLPAASSFTVRLENTIKAADGVALESPVSWTFMTGACPCTLFSPASQPARQNLPTQDGRPGAGPWSYELGVKVRVDQPVQLTALRFYKSPQETGGHVGKVWTASGTELGRVSFVAETASGWQHQALETPLSLEADTTYVVSVNQNSHFGMTDAGLQNQIISGPLSSVADGQNGVYGASAGLFPTQSWNSSNYFVDLEVMPAGLAPPPGVSSTTPADGAMNVARTTTVRATFTRPLNPATVNGSNFTLTGPGGAVAAAVTYDSGTRTAILTPSAALAPTTTFTANLSTGIRSSDGRPLSDPVSWSFTTATLEQPRVLSVVPGDGSTDMGTAIRPRAEFSRAMDGTSINTSTFTLTSPGGPVAGAVTYSNTTRTATFTPGSSLTAGTTYTARLDGSIRSSEGATLGTAYTWTFTINASPPPITVSAHTPADGAVGVPRETKVTFTFDRAVDPTTINSATIHLHVPPDLSAIVPAALSYDGATRTATLTPTTALAPNTRYNGAVHGVKAADGTGNAIKDFFFTTSACPCSLFPTTLAPTAQGNSTQDGRSGAGPWTYEFGVKFRVDQLMTLSAIEFYKDPSETGPHKGTVWTATGTKLGEVTFANETASGWQTQALDLPIGLEAGVTYVVSVNANTFFGVTPGGLATEVVSGPLRSVADGQNGTFAETAGTFPTSSWNSTNYFVDLVVR